MYSLSSNIIMRQNKTENDERRIVVIKMTQWTEVYHG